MEISKICSLCSQVFVPKKFGHNAKFCSKTCRDIRTYEQNKIYRKAIPPEIRKLRRKRSYTRIKEDVEKYSKHLQSTSFSNKAIRIWLAQYKVERGCIDCGYRGHFSALQIDHQGPKTASISEIRTSRDRILAEIDTGNCVVRCAVCHAVKTWTEKNGLIYEPSMANRKEGCNEREEV